jgi:hypothetical protein
LSTLSSPLSAASMASPVVVSQLLTWHCRSRISGFIGFRGGGELLRRSGGRGARCAFPASSCGLALLPWWIRSQYPWSSSPILLQEFAWTAFSSPSAHLLAYSQRVSLASLSICLSSSSESLPVTQRPSLRDYSAENHRQDPAQDQFHPGPRRTSRQQLLHPRELYPEDRIFI